MAAITVRGLDDNVKERLRLRAARNGNSMEAEARLILEAAVASEAVMGFGSRIHARFAALGGVELDIPPRTDQSRAPTFE
ncbi:hypothetical protein [Sporichthya sp.]|uniref:FitA-like ribbon-helix-helix domain-containing protein n=1 Tax=Sporichthya sp. TaxID=65475 RepID=UPI00183BA2F2|nr:hypothetical protein [Sporichthya sp.]MBA3744532.1 plasmid stabilization protein [Sporichthya sp.]